MIKKKGKEFIIGLMDRGTRAVGLMGNNMTKMGNIHQPKEKPNLENGMKGKEYNGIQ